MRQIENNSFDLLIEANGPEVSSGIIMRLQPVAAIHSLHVDGIVSRSGRVEVGIINARNHFVFNSWFPVGLGSFEHRSSVQRCVPEMMGIRKFPLDTDYSLNAEMQSITEVRDSIQKNFQTMNVGDAKRIIQGGRKLAQQSKALLFLNKSGLFLHESEGCRPCVFLGGRTWHVAVDYYLYNKKKYIVFDYKNKRNQWKKLVIDCSHDHLSRIKQYPSYREAMVAVINGQPSASYTIAPAWVSMITAMVNDKTCQASTLGDRQKYFSMALMRAQVDAVKSHINNRSAINYDKSNKRSSLEHYTLYNNYFSNDVSTSADSIGHAMAYSASES